MTNEQTVWQTTQIEGQTDRLADNTNRETDTTGIQVFFASSSLEA